MRVRVLLFGPAADAAGQGAVEVQLDADRTCAAVLDALARMRGLGPLVPSCRLAVNHEFAPPHRTIRDSDEVALIGLVSGG